MTKRKNISIFVLLACLSLVAITGSLLIGRYSISINELWHYMASLFNSNIEKPEQIETVLLYIRLPRILAAFLVGGLLSITGAAYQGMFRNPMVSPSILGVSAGSAFGAALSILLGASTAILQLTSFSFGIIAIVGVYLISLSTGKKHEKCLTLILAGMIVGTVFTSLVSVLKYIADPDETLSSIVFWLMGGFTDIQTKDLRFPLLVAIVGVTFLTLSGWKLDMLSFGDDEAKTMGIHVDRFRMLVIGIATLMTATAVSISGVIGWVGLLIPHIVRMLISSKNAVLLPASFLIGGIFLLIVDNMSRAITAMEIPLGITTSLIGAPFFIFILMKTSKK